MSIAKTCNNSIITWYNRIRNDRSRPVSERRKHPPPKKRASHLGGNLAPLKVRVVVINIISMEQRHDNNSRSGGAASVPLLLLVLALCRRRHWPSGTLHLTYISLDGERDHQPTRSRLTHTRDYIYRARALCACSRDGFWSLDRSCVPLKYRRSSGLSSEGPG